MKKPSPQHQPHPCQTTPPPTPTDITHHQQRQHHHVNIHLMRQDLPLLDEEPITATNAITYINTLINHPTPETNNPPTPAILADHLAAMKQSLTQHEQTWTIKENHHITNAYTQYARTWHHTIHTPHTINLDVLHTLITTCNSATPRGQRNAIALALGWWLLTTPGELVHLKAGNNITITPTNMTIRIFNPANPHHTTTRTIPRNPLNPHTCPVTLTTTWLNTLGKANNSHSPLIIASHPGTPPHHHTTIPLPTRPITLNALGTLIRDLTKNAGLHPQSTNQLRVGAITTALNHGTSLRSLTHYTGNYAYPKYIQSKLTI